MALGGRADMPHLPHPAPDRRATAMAASVSAACRIAARCSAFPTGIWAWPVNDVAELDEAALAPVFDRAESIDVFLLGTGRDPWMLPDACRQRFRELSLSVDAMTTGAAVRTYNILLAESRRVGAGLIAVG